MEILRKYIGGDNILDPIKLKTYKSFKMCKFKILKVLFDLFSVSDFLIVPIV